jgi:site-specific DNA-methyltransferase (adenine-specific)
MIDLMQGDCLERMKEIPDGSVDMILTDPPYGTTACKWDSIIPLEPMWEQLKRIIKPNGAIVITASQPFTSVLINSNIKQFKYSWVWEKSKASNFLQAGYMPLKSHEDIVVFCEKGKPTYNPQMVDGKPYSGEKRAGKKGSNSDVVNNVPNPQKRKGSSDGRRKPRTVQYFKTAESEGKTSHPTQKPVALMEYLIKTYTNENETVLDFTMGSGTTGCAAKKLNRDFIGIELDEAYFNIAKERIENT